jgi:hypothetical protein
LCRDPDSRRLAGDARFPRIDHVAPGINSVQQWSALLERIRLSGVSYELNEVPLTGERQVFLTMTPDVVSELANKAGNSP